MIKIRSFDIKDAQTLALIFHDSVRKMRTNHYTEEQVQSWSPHVPPIDRYIRASQDGRVILVAVQDNEEVVAYGELEKTGHIDHLYCRSDICGQGVGSALYDALEKEAIMQDIQTLYVEASEMAKTLFEKKGFTILERQDFSINSVMIHNYKMEKILTDF